MKKPKFQISAKQAFAVTGALLFISSPADYCFAEASITENDAFTLPNGMNVQLVKPQTSSKSFTQQKDGQAVMISAASLKKIGMSSAPSAYIGEEGNEIGAKAVGELPDQEKKQTDQDKQLQLWGDMLQEMIGKSRGFTAEEARAHQRTIESLFEVEIEED